MFELSVVTFAESIEIPDEISDVEAKKLMEIETTHPAFYNWLAYYLTLQNSNKISFILDMYASEKYGPTQKFNNVVEFILVNCLAHVPFEHQAQDDAVVRWVREKNYATIDNPTENKAQQSMLRLLMQKLSTKSLQRNQRKRPVKKRAALPYFKTKK